MAIAVCIDNRKTLSRLLYRRLGRDDPQQLAELIEIDKTVLIAVEVFEALTNLAGLLFRQFVHAGIIRSEAAGYSFAALEKRQKHGYNNHPAIRVVQRGMVNNSD